MMRVSVPGVLLAIVLAAAAGCGGGPAAPTAPPATPTITINGQNGTQAFSPNPALFGGQMVVFKNNDTVVHRVVLNDGTIDTGDLSPGSTSRAVAMPAAGTNYHCDIHPGMIGAVSAASGGAAPPCEGLYCDGY